MTRAGRPCLRSGCPNLQPCPVHPRIPWAGSNRAQRLPPNWEFVKRRVMRRDKGICHVCGGAGATEIDHLVAGDDHSMANLAAIHHACHLRKSSQEGHAARRQQAGLG